MTLAVCVDDTSIDRGHGRHKGTGFRAWHHMGSLDWVEKRLEFARVAVPIQTIRLLATGLSSLVFRWLGIALLIVLLGV